MKFRLAAAAALVLASVVSRWPVHAWPVLLLPSPAGPGPAELWSCDAVTPPLLVIVAGVHGDEPAGPLGIAILRDALAAGAASGASASGTVLAIPMAFPEAAAAGTRWADGWSDLNRAFGQGAGGGALQPPEESATGRALSADPTPARAAALLRTILAAASGVADAAAVLVLDLHESDESWTEGQQPALVVPSGQSGPARGPASATAGAALALAMLESGDLQDFSFSGPPPRGSLVAAVAESGLSMAMLVEVPGHWPLSARINAQLRAVRAAALALGFNPAWPEPALP